MPGGTRSRVGMFDASTLGKIEIVGPDAAEFMNRMYTNAWTKLEPGRCRYGLHAERGRLHHATTASSAASRRTASTSPPRPAARARVLHMMEDYLQTEWPDLKVWLTSTTEQWAVIALQRAERAQD